MKNFYEITDIDTTDKLIVTIRIIRHGTIEADIKLNGVSIEDCTVKKFDLFDPVVLEITVSDFIEGISGIEIAELSINGYDVLPKYQHLAYPKTNYIDFKTPFKIEIPSPFYVWYHNITGQGWFA